jgi:hypothetical protein
MKQDDADHRDSAQPADLSSKMSLHQLLVRQPLLTAEHAGAESFEHHLQCHCFVEGIE